MLKHICSQAARWAREAIKKMIVLLPREQRFKVIRSFADCDPTPSNRIVLKIAETKEELEACFAVLHDAYVDSGYMKPDPSGMRVTVYHALPTTTILCAKYDGVVVGTISLIRESALGFPLQRIFDLSAVREKEGQIAEVSALAIHRKFRKTGGSVLFPLMKFIYEYCTIFFDTRHLVIAVNPNQIEMFESLLLFQRLTAKVENYDLWNGAPAIGATIDLKETPEILRKYYPWKPTRRNLYAYFTQVKLPNIQFPNHRFFTTNNPVLTPELLDYFFNVRTHTFAKLSERKKALLYKIYDLPAYRAVLPIPFAEANADPSRKEDQVRQHLRFSVKCPGQVIWSAPDGKQVKTSIRIIEVSPMGFQAVAHEILPTNIWCEAIIKLGHADLSQVNAFIARETRTDSRGVYGFKLDKPDLTWRKFVSALLKGSIYSELDNATRFLESRFAQGPVADTAAESKNPEPPITDRPEDAAKGMPQPSGDTNWKP